jgi:hypothetical protein
VAGNTFPVTSAASWHEVPQRDANDPSDTGEVAKPWVCLAVLNALVRVPGDVGLQVHLFLRKPGCTPSVLNPKAEPSERLLLIVLHPQTLRVS